MTTSDDFIPKCMKYSVFFLILLYWFLGAFSTAAGLYVHFWEMQPLQELIYVPFSPAFMLIILGLVLFITALIGCVGALRENIYFLRLFLVIQLFLFVAYIATSVVAFVVLLFPATVSVHAEEMLRKAVITYKDDDQSAAYIDKIQTSIKCCGIGYKGYKDWMLNPYFSCNENNFSAEKCGVPASCCRFDLSEGIDTTCGYGITDNAITSKLKVSSVINTQGCISKVEEIVGNAAEFLFFSAFMIATTLICGIVLSSRMVNVLKKKVNEYWKNYNMVNNMMHYIPNSCIYNIPWPLQKGHSCT